MAAFEEIIRMVYPVYRKSKNPNNLPCPNEETLSCFSEGKLADKESKQIQEHLLLCQRCAEIVSIFLQEFQQQRQVPEALMNKAKDLVKDTSGINIFEVVLAVKEKMLQILSTTGDVIVHNEILPLPVLRARHIEHFADGVKLIKEFQNIRINVDVHKRASSRVKIRIALADKRTLHPLRDLRLVLMKGDYELESYESESGHAVFDKVPVGKYSICILYKGKEIGVVNLEVT